MRFGITKEEAGGSWVWAKRRRGAGLLAVTMGSSFRRIRLLAVMHKAKNPAYG
jgi:hypothetical protein